MEISAMTDKNKINKLNINCIISYIIRQIWIYWEWTLVTWVWFWLVFGKWIFSIPIPVLPKSTGIEWVPKIPKSHQYRTNTSSTEKYWYWKVPTKNFRYYRGTSVLAVKWDNMQKSLFKHFYWLNKIQNYV